MPGLPLDEPGSRRVAAAIAPLGWALYSGWPSAETRALLDQRPTDLDAALTHMWNSNGSALLKHVGLPLGRYGRLRSTEFQRRFQLRALLVLEALACHTEGHFAAATALTLAQIDGLTTDVMGSTFFQHQPDPTAPGYTDDVTLAGIEGNLPVVREAFSAPYDTTGRHGSISRHAILHGRDLTYATRATSTKALVLLGALVERLEAPADERARRERRRIDGLLMKLSGFDERGRLLDTRCLDEVRMFRADLDTAVHEQLRFRTLTEAKLLEAALTRLRERRLHQASFRILGVGEKRYAWTFRLPSGHFLGSSHEMTSTSIPVQSIEMTWDAGTVPTLPPWSDADGWTKARNGDPQTPNWEFQPYFS